MLGIKTRLRLLATKMKWRKLNPHNDTQAKNIFDVSLVSVGNYTYGDIMVYSAAPLGKLEIGSFCSIAPDVAFVMNNEHRVDAVSTYPLNVKLLKSEKPEAFSKGGIVVGDDVWIGARATVLDGVTIGQGAVIAAGSVVTKDVEPYTIVGGVPAKLIRRRFNEEMSSMLLGVDFGKFDRDFVERNATELSSTVTNDVVKRLINEQS